MIDPKDVFQPRDSFSLYRNVRSKTLIRSPQKQKPEITIAIPTFNRPALLCKAIQSAANQRTNNPFEILVVDNGSLSSSADLVYDVCSSLQLPNLSLFRNEANIGMFGNWNRCVELARGEWVTILNDDDELLPGFLDVVAQLRSAPKMVACMTDFFGPKATQRPLWVNALKWIVNFTSPQVSPLGLGDFLFGHPFSGSLGILYFRKAILRQGGFDEKFQPAADHVLNVRYWRNYGGDRANAVLARYRIETNESLKAEVGVAFVQSDHSIRNAIIEEYFCNPLAKRISVILSGFQTQFLACAMESSVWRNRFRSDEILRKFGVRNFRLPYFPRANTLMRIIWAVVGLWSFQKVRN